MSTPLEQFLTAAHPSFSVGAKVRARGWRMRGEVIYSALDKVVINWGDSVQSYDGWAVANNVVPIAFADAAKNDPAA